MLLIGSHRLAGTVESFFAVRNYTLGAVSLLLFWAFSPIGGQSSLRLLSMRPSILNSTETLWYLSSNSTSGFRRTSSSASTVSLVNALYQASLLPPLSIKSLA